MSDSRGKIYIDRSVQGALAKRIALHWCVFFLLASISLIGLECFMGDPNLTFEGRLLTVWNKYALFFVLMLAVVPSFVYDTVKLSHRFAGPITRLKGSLAKLAQGEEIKEIKFREGDFWSEMASDLNRVSVRIRDLEGQTQENVEETTKIDERTEVVSCGK